MQYNNSEEMPLINPVFDPKSLLRAVRTGEENVLLVDVGGNQGHDLKLFQKCKDDLPGSLILQDLPEAVKKLEKKLDGIEVMAYDFFTPQSIKGSFILLYLVLQMISLLCAGIERTEKQWRELIDFVDLEIVKIRRTERVEAVIEIMLKESMFS